MKRLNLVIFGIVFFIIIINSYQAIENQKDMKLTNNKKYSLEDIQIVL